MKGLRGLRPGVTLTESLVAIVLIGIISIVAFSLVSFSLVSNAVYSQQATFANFLDFVTNELIVRGAKDDSICSVGDELTRKFHGLSQQSTLTDVYPKVQRISVRSQANVPGTDIRACRVLEVVFIKDVRGTTETILIFQGRP